MEIQRFLLIIFACLIFKPSLAQSPEEAVMKRKIDSIKLAALADYATKYPMLRQGAFAVDMIGSRRVKGELNGSDLFEGKTSVTRIRSNFTIPLVQFGKNVVTGTISYQQIHFATSEVKSYQPAFAAVDQSLNKQTVGFTVSFTRLDSLFNRPISYSGSLSGLTNEFSSIKRLNYIGNVIYSLSRTPTSSWAVGLAVVVDPSSVAPVVPFVSYWHHYKNSNLDLFIDMPSRIALRKQLSSKSWASVGSELGGNLYFFDIKQASLPENSVYSTIDLRTGLTLEYMLTKKIVVGVSGGMYTLARSTMFEHNAKTSDYFFKTNGGTVPYLTVSMSLLPFIKSWK
ncbi:DUF6268 family outer membrane beta-barrel protein [Mucilaginibacter defluvii]|uniref:DUF6268 domain-containing protein n=1 Tax=Mucilaginibacter defluvii TaxID=1196019 RepID=A0ABP9GA67_9SPHI